LEIVLDELDLIVVEVHQFAKNRQKKKNLKNHFFKFTSSFCRSCNLYSTFVGARAPEYSLRESRSDSRDFERNLLINASLLISFSCNFY